MYIELEQCCDENLEQCMNIKSQLNILEIHISLLHKCLFVTRVDLTFCAFSFPLHNLLKRFGERGARRYIQL